MSRIWYRPELATIRSAELKPVSEIIQIKGVEKAILLTNLLDLLVAQSSEPVQPGRPDKEISISIERFLNHISCFTFTKVKIPPQGLSIVCGR
jgi:hypothetical protein